MEARVRCHGRRRKEVVTQMRTAPSCRMWSQCGPGGLLGKQGVEGWWEGTTKGTETAPSGLLWRGEWVEPQVKRAGDLAAVSDIGELTACFTSRGLI